MSVFKRAIIVISTMALIFGLSACGEPPTDTERAQAVAELTARGFTDPLYFGPAGEFNTSQAYSVGVGAKNCRLVLTKDTYGWVFGNDEQDMSAATFQSWYGTNKSYASCFTPSSK